MSTRLLVLAASLSAPALAATFAQSTPLAGSQPTLANTADCSSPYLSEAERQALCDGLIQVKATPKSLTDGEELPPLWLTVDADSNVYVALANEILTYRADGALLRLQDEAEYGEGEAIIEPDFAIAGDDEIGAGEPWYTGVFFTSADGSEFYADPDGNVYSSTVYEFDGSWALVADLDGDGWEEWVILDSGVATVYCSEGESFEIPGAYDYVAGYGGGLGLIGHEGGVYVYSW